MSLHPNLDKLEGLLNNYLNMVQERNARIDALTSELRTERKKKEMMQDRIKKLEAQLKARDETIARLEAVPKPNMPLPGVTVQALGVLCNIHTGYEVRRLNGVIAEKDAEIQRLRDDTGNLSPYERSKLLVIHYKGSESKGKGKGKSSKGKYGKGNFNG